MKIKQCLHLYIFISFFFNRLQQPQFKDYIVPWFLVKMPKIVLFTFIQKGKKKTPLCTQVICDRVEIRLDTWARRYNNRGNLIGWPYVEELVKLCGLLLETSFVSNRQIVVTVGGQINTPGWH